MQVSKPTTNNCTSHYTLPANDECSHGSRQDTRASDTIPYDDAFSYYNEPFDSHLPLITCFYPSFIQPLSSLPEYATHRHPSVHPHPPLPNLPISPTQRYLEYDIQHTVYTNTTLSRDTIPIPITDHQYKINTRLSATELIIVATYSLVPFGPPAHAKLPRYPHLSTNDDDEKHTKRRRYPDHDEYFTLLPYKKSSHIILPVSISGSGPVYILVFT